MSDTTAPVLTGLHLPSTIDLRGGGPLTITVDTSDASAISTVVIELDAMLATADGETTTGIAIGGVWTPSGDNFLDATPYTATRTMNLSAATSAGTYGIKSIHVSDVAGNTALYYADQLTALGFASGFTVTGSVVDRTAPTLTGLTLPATIDLSKGPGQLIASATAADNAGGNGIQTVLVTLDRSLATPVGPYPYLFLGYSAGSTDTFTDGTPHSGNLVFDLGADTAPGTYSVLSAEVRDASGNSRTYTGSDLAALGFDTDFTVTGSVADTVAPVLTDLRLPSYIDLREPRQEVEFIAQADDAGGSGIATVRVQLDRPLATLDVALDVILFHGPLATDAAGSMRRLEDAIAATQPGAYNITSAQVTDLAGNVASYSVDQLRDLGIRTRFFAGDGSAVPATAGAMVRMDGDNVVLTFTAAAWQAGAADAAIRLTYDATHLHYLGIAQPATAMSGATAEEHGHTGTVSAWAQGQSDGTPLVFALTFRQTGSSTDLAFTLNSFAVGAVQQQLAGGEVVLFRHGGAGDDRLAGGQGNDHIDGGAGNDSVRYAMPGADLRVSATENGYRVTDGVAIDERLINVELIEFSDRALAPDPEGIAGDAFRLYQAAFDRVADKGGLGFWIAQLQRGVPLLDVAAEFVRSPEFQSLYGTAPSSAAFVDTLYEHVLHRAADAQGLQYWLDVLAAGHTRAEVLLAFSESPENHAQVVGAIQNGVEYVPYG